MLCSWKVAVPFPQTAPSKTSQGPALFPSRPANLPPGRGAGPGIAMNRNLTDAGAGQPRGQLRAESEERAASRRGRGPSWGRGLDPGYHRDGRIERKAPGDAASAGSDRLL